MWICRLMLLAALAVSLSFAQSEDSTLYDAGRKVSVKPIGDIGFGGYGGPGWGVAVGVAGIGVLGLGALLTAKFVK